MSSLDKLPNSFHAAGTNGCLDLSLPRSPSCCPTNCLCSTWSGSWIAQFAKESIAPYRRSSAGWMPASTGKISVGVERKHPVTMRKASLRMLSMRQICILIHQTVAQYLSMEYTKERAEMGNVLAPAPHPDPASCLNSATRLESFFAQSFEVVTESERPIQLYPKIRWDWTGKL